MLSCSASQDIVPDGLELLRDALYGYFMEIESCRVICARHESEAAIHSKGKTLQLYRLFKRDEVTAKQIINAVKELPGWEESIYYKKGGKLHRLWEKMYKEVEHRMVKHKKLRSIVTRGVEWEGLPILVHGYKYEPDPVMKVELLVAPYESPAPELPIQIMSSLLRCHEHIVPEYIASPLPPYERHEAAFEMISDYLSRTMPKDLYATQCLPRMPCYS